MTENPLGRILDRIFWALSSLKLAVVVIFSLTISLAVATVVESRYDTPTAQFWIYKAFWFRGILGLLGLNIFSVAISRFPWKRKHTAFLLAHLGILLLLFGSWLTDRIGIDGSLRLSEGESSRIVELDQAAFVISEGSQVHAFPIRWLPPGVHFEPFRAFVPSLKNELKVDQFLSHAESNTTFVASGDSVPDHSHRQAALRLKITGGPMKISQDIWLWEGGSTWKDIQAGPARFSINATTPVQNPGAPSLEWKVSPSGTITYLAKASDGKIKKGSFSQEKIQGQVIHPGWKGDVQIRVEQWLPDAQPLVTYHPSRIQYGPQAPTSAIHVIAGTGVEVWLGLGDRAVLHLGERDVDIGYVSKRVVLPFTIRLDRFSVEHDQGTLSPASYSSRITVMENTGQKDVLISMNEPLQMKGYSVYQASYEDGQPRPITSIFSVNQDPGRPWKYLGSLLIVLGSVLLFAAKYRQSRSQNSIQYSRVIDSSLEV